jgi:drug/metabolite transporter (DMT)-like permease
MTEYLMTTEEATRPAGVTAPASGVGMSLAIGSAAAFGLSGPLAKSLLTAGWSPTAVVLARLTGASLVLALPVVLLLRGRWRETARSAKPLLLYGIVAVGGLQVCYVNAVRYLSVGVALLLEYSAPVLILLWTWWRTKTRPARPTLIGALLAIIGLILVLDLTNGAKLSLVGVGWGLLAAVCLACYFVMSERSGSDLSPVVMAGAGMATGAAAAAGVGALGVLPLTFTSVTTELRGHHLHWIVPVAVLVLFATVLAYVTGVAAVGRLGARVGSFTALAEVMFAIVAAWLLLDEWPHQIQLVGGAFIVAGIVLIRADSRDIRAQLATATASARTAPSSPSTESSPIDTA